ncbi:MAG: carbohydrate-binding protein, partial [Daejeonella sp.]
SLPRQGQIMPVLNNDGENTTLNLNAVYTDQGSAGVKPLTASETIRLRSNILHAREITQRTRLALKDSTATGLIVYPQTNGWMKLSGIDLKGINSIDLKSINGLDEAAYTVEVRLDGENGKLIGSTEVGSGSAPKELVSRINLQPATDAKLHDVYIVIRTAKTVRRRPMLQSLTFNSI